MNSSLQQSGCEREHKGRRIEDGGMVKHCIFHFDLSRHLDIWIRFRFVDSLPSKQPRQHTIFQREPASRFHNAPAVAEGVPGLPRVAQLRAVVPVGGAHPLIDHGPVVPRRVGKDARAAVLDALGLRMRGMQGNKSGRLKADLISRGPQECRTLNTRSFLCFCHQRLQNRSMKYVSMIMSMDLLVKMRLQTFGDAVHIDSLHAPPSRSCFC